MDSDYIYRAHTYTFDLKFLTVQVKNISSEEKMLLEHLTKYTPSKKKKSYLFLLLVTFDDEGFSHSVFFLFIHSEKKMLSSYT